MDYSSSAAMNALPRLRGSGPARPSGSPPNALTAAAMSPGHVAMPSRFWRPRCSDTALVAASNFPWPRGNLPASRGSRPGCKGACAGSATATAGRRCAGARVLEPPAARLDRELVLPSGCSVREPVPRVHVVGLQLERLLTRLQRRVVLLLDVAVTDVVVAVLAIGARPTSR